MISMTGKVGIPALCSMFAAYILGCRLASPDAATSWHTYAAAVSLALCLAVFMRNLLALHKTLTQLSEKYGSLKDDKGMMLIP
jgi:hypothetical protein